MYQRLLGEVSDLRQGNRRRIRKGLWALVGVTVGLLALVFISQSSKVIFLLLWIVSMFGVAAYLIGVEYMDYQMQHKVGHIANMREGELSEILTLPESSPKSRLAARLRREADVLEGVETPPEPEESIPAVFDLPRSLVDLEPRGQGFLLTAHHAGAAGAGTPRPGAARPGTCGTSGPRRRKRRWKPRGVLCPVASRGAGAPRAPHCPAPAYPSRRPRAGGCRGRGLFA